MHPCVVDQPRAGACQGKSFAPLGFSRMAGGLRIFWHYHKGALRNCLCSSSHCLVFLFVGGWCVPVEVLFPLEREEVSRRAAQVLLWDTLHPLVKQGPMQGLVLDMQETCGEPTKALPYRFLRGSSLALCSYLICCLQLLGCIGGVW